MKEANQPLNGTVEVDETYIGGNRTNVRGNKHIVLAAIERR